MFFGLKNNKNYVLGKKDKSVTVKVETNKEELQLKQINITVEKDQTFKLEVVNVLEDDIFSWTSNNETVATVDQFGVVTGVHAGTTTIVCRESDGRSVSTRVTVTSDEVLIENISLAPQTIAIGEKVQLKPTISPENGLAIYTWKRARKGESQVYAGVMPCHFIDRRNKTGVLNMCVLLGGFFYLRQVRACACKDKCRLAAQFFCNQRVGAQQKFNSLFFAKTVREKYGELKSE